MFLTAKVQKKSKTCNIFSKRFAYTKKKQYFCTTYLNDIHNKDYSVV